MIEDSQGNVLKNIAKSLKETNLKMDSLVRLLEALDSVEEVLGSAVAQFRKKGVKSPMNLVKDCIEPKKLGMLYIYFKDQPLMKSFDFLAKKQEETEGEISALEKRQIRLQLCKGVLGEDTDSDLRTIKEPLGLPIIEEDKPCTPRLGKFKMDENGHFMITEEYNSEDEEEDIRAGCAMTKSTIRKKSNSNPSQSRANEDAKRDSNAVLNKMDEKTEPEHKFVLVESVPMEEKSSKEIDSKRECISDTKEDNLVYIRAAEDLKELDGNSKVEAARVVIQGTMDDVECTTESEESDIPDLEFLRKLDNMNLDEGECASKLHHELFEEEDWLLPPEEEESLPEVPSSFSQEIARIRNLQLEKKKAAERKQDKDNATQDKIKDAVSNVKVRTPSQTQSSGQDQDELKPLVVTKEPDEVCENQSKAPQKCSPFTAKVFERQTKHKPSKVGVKPKKKISKFKRSLLLNE